MYLDPPLYPLYTLNRDHIPIFKGYRKGPDRFITMTLSRGFQHHVRASTVPGVKGLGFGLGIADTTARITKVISYSNRESPDPTRYTLCVKSLHPPHALSALEDTEEILLRNLHRVAVPNT